MIIRALPQIIAVITILCCSSSTRATPSPLFWQNEIDSSLVVRNNFFTSCGIVVADTLYGMSNGTKATHIATNLLQSSQTETSWYNFISGALLLFQPNALESASSYADSYFDAALRDCSKNPGTTWLLFCAFKNFQLPLWEEKSISQLQRIYLEQGVLRAPIISQQLLYFGINDKNTLNAERRSFYLSWAKKFDKHLIWSTLWNSYFEFLSNPVKASSTAYFDIARHMQSWNFALSIFQITWLWLGAFLLIGIFVLMGLLAGRHLDGAVHKLSHQFPKVVRPDLRQTFSILLVLSVLFLGIAPFLWVLSFFLWRQIRSWGKLLVIFAMIFISLAPFYFRVSDMLSQPNNPDNVLYLYQRSINEGYSTHLEQTLRNNTGSKKTYLNLVALANNAIKNNDVILAQSAISKALQVKPEDPIVLLCAGNISFFAQDYEKANEYFSTCLRLFPEMETSFFNPCNYYFSTMRITEGIKLIENATKINSERISEFIKTNDDYFGSNWPMLRQYIQPDFSNSFFFKNILRDFGGNWDSTQKLFGTFFFGLSPLPYSIVSAFLLLALIVSGTTSGKSRKFFCRQCGIPICHKCKKIAFCENCNSILGDINTNEMLQQVGARIIRQKQMLAALLQSIFNLLVPGSGVLLKNVKFLIVPTIQVIVSCALYAVLWVCVTTQSSYPSWVTECIKTPVIYGIGIYLCLCALVTLTNLSSTLSRIYKNGTQR